LLGVYKGKLGQEKSQYVLQTFGDKGRKEARGRELRFCNFPGKGEPSNSIILICSSSDHD